MREMKHSGVSWIGEIPADWDLIPAKRLFRSNKKIVGNAVNGYDRLALTMSGVIKRSKEDNEGLQPDKFEGYQILQENELVFKLIDLENVKTSRVGLSPYTGLVSPAYIVLSSDLDDNRFYFYWYMSLYYNEVFNRLGGNGVRSALNAKDILSLPIPDIDESVKKHIADYLDTKCAKIDAIIAKQQQVIEKQKAYKLSVITEAVTRGLNPDVPMKDSGIEWIGLVPKHWKMVRLKFLLSQIIDCPHETPIYSADGNYLVIRTADQDIGKLRTDEDMYRLNESEYWNRIRRMSLEKDDIVYGREGERWGLACLVPESNKYCLGQRMLQFRCKSELFLPYFAMWALNSKFVYLQGAVDTIGSTSPHVNISTVRNFIIPLPKIAEQREIAVHISKKMLRLDKELEHREILIDKLNDYKKSLIYEVVTGKRRIDTGLPEVITIAAISPELLKYKKAVLMARIIDGLGDHVLGRVQIQKGLYFAETSSNPRLHLETDYARYTHGPFDREIWDYEAIMAEHGWIYTSDESERTIYKRGEHFSEYWDEYQRLFLDCEKTVQRIIDFVRQFQYTDGVEKVATLFAAWNDFIIDGITSPTDEAIIAEVRNHWTENKGKIKERTWRKSLAQLKSAQFIPQGYGKHTVKWQGGQAHG